MWLKNTLWKQNKKIPLFDKPNLDLRRCINFWSPPTPLSWGCWSSGEDPKTKFYIILIVVIKTNKLEKTKRHEIALFDQMPWFDLGDLEKDQTIVFPKLYRTKALKLQLIKVSRSRNKIVKPKLLPKNEWTNLFFYPEK